MGDMAEMYQEWEYAYDEDDDREEEYASRGIWPAKTGEIPVIEMDDAHLANALAYIQKSSLNSPLESMLRAEIGRRKLKVTDSPSSIVDNFAHASYIHALESYSEHFCKPSICVWAIRQKSTGYFLPARKSGRGYSFSEPTKDCFPRLFPSKLSATRALSAWLQGQWKREYHTREIDGWPEDIEYITSEKVEGRNRDDMEIVEFTLLEVAK